MSRRSVIDFLLYPVDAVVLNPNILAILTTGKRCWVIQQCISLSLTNFLALDYIFILDVEGSRPQILGLLAPHLRENLEPGLPQQGVCGSDHISLVAELFWQSITPCH